MEKEIVLVLCLKCKRRTKHEIIAEVKRENVEHENNEFDGSSESYGGFYRETSTFQIIECRGCETISYQQFITSTSDDDVPKIIHEIIYPLRDITAIDFKDFGPIIPKKIKELYQEVIQTFNNKLGVLCAAGIRAIIEGICNEKIGKDKVVKHEEGTKLPKSENLMEKINALSKLGVISTNNANILHQLRYLGNQAVHQLDKPSDDKLKLAIDIIENTLSTIYEIEIKALKLSQTDFNLEKVEENSYES